MIEQASGRLKSILELMKVDADVIASEDAERVTLEVRGAESGLLIGKHGATLDALQYLVNKMGAQGMESLPKPVVVDSEGYRQRRADSLIELAQRLAEKARQTGRPVAASPMSPADRRVMHIALADAADVSTRSEGEGQARHLIIVPGKKSSAAPASPLPLPLEEG